MLIRHQVEHAVADDNVSPAVLNRQSLGGALAERYVVPPDLGRRPTLWGGKTSVVLRLPIRRCGVVRSTLDAIGQYLWQDALSAQVSAIRASGAGAPGCSTARTRSARTEDAAHPAR